jgi:DNA (cytosine-5)-methyltransferase 1
MIEKTAVSLFSGAGGLDLGFERAGFQIVFANEADHDAADTWRANRAQNASAMHEGRIEDFLPELEKYRGKVSILFGGPPCQGFSVAGKMDPEDKRSDLVFTFLDAVKLVQPEVFVMENVKALATLDKWNGVRERYIAKAESMGYRVSYSVFRTADYGVPQKRDRVIFIGVKNGDTGKFKEEMERMHHAAPTAREVLLSAGIFGTEKNPDTCAAAITLAKRPVMRKSPYAGMLVNGAGRPIDLDGLPPTLPATMGGNKTPIIDQHALEDKNALNWFAAYHMGLESGECVPEETKIPDFVRRLTLKEASAIQTFPKDYVFRGARNKQYRQIGNAVPPLFAYHVALAVDSAYSDKSLE